MSEKRMVSPTHFQPLTAGGEEILRPHAEELASQIIRQLLHTRCIFFTNNVRLRIAVNAVCQLCTCFTLSEPRHEHRQKVSVLNVIEDFSP